MPIVYWLVIVIFNWLIRVSPKAIRFVFLSFCRFCIAPFVTPTGYLRYGDCEGSSGYDSLTREGFEVESKWASDALQRIQKK